MADREIDLNLTKGTEITASDAAPELTMQEARARVAKVLSRSLVSDRFNVTLPPHLHGEWVANNPVDLHRMSVMGFEVDTVYAPKHALNDRADGGAYIGDVVFMTCPKIIKEAYEQLRREEYARLHLTKKQREERDFENNNKTLDMPVTVESTSNQISGTEIETTLKDK